ncbi:MAG: efflux RND transporter permease subunit, partial [Chloroflexi bacterium]|nr:efflux RND transporter permease subunit [Chloroflexota bacterium]
LPALQRVLIATPTGAYIPLSYVADFEIVKGPALIKSENARNNAWIYVDLRGIDVGTYVKNAKQVIAAEVDIPDGYSIVWSGQYEYMERANQRLRIVIPITLLIIFLLLFLNFRNIQESLLVMMSLPFAMVGGIWLLYVLDYNLSVAVGVGFIALSGVAAEIGVILLTYLDQSYKERVSAGRMNNLADLKEAIFSGTARRIRPIIMTVTAIIAGLLPIMWGHGTGSQVMKRIAAPMIGGMVSVTILSLLVLPAVYFLWKSREVRRNNESAA